MIGGLFLCFEGVEKLVHTWHERKHKNSISNEEAELQRLNELANKSDAELVQMEKDKIKIIKVDEIGTYKIDYLSLSEIGELL